MLPRVSRDPGEGGRRGQRRACVRNAFASGFVARGVAGTLFPSAIEFHALQLMATPRRGWGARGKKERKVFA